MSETTLKRIFGRPPEAGTWKLRQHSLSKLWIGLADGRTLTFWSRDWPHDKSGLRDQVIGIKRFEKNILNRMDRYPYTTAIIYDAHSDEVIAKYREGKKLAI
jgi:hypothetical protein